MVGLHTKNHLESRARELTRRDPAANQIDENLDARVSPIQKNTFLPMLPPCLLQSTSSLSKADLLFYEISVTQINLASDIAMTTPIPQPPGIPLLGNIFNVDPSNTWTSLQKLWEKYG